MKVEYNLRKGEYCLRKGDFDVQMCMYVYITYVKSLTTRTSNENASIAVFISWGRQLNVVYRRISFLIRSSGVMNVRKVVMNASPNAVGITEI